MTTHEHTINVALGEVLGDLRPHSWRVVSEQQGQLRGGGRPDILIEEASQWPVVIEAEKSDHDSAELEAQQRLGRIVNETRKPVESAIAVVYPPEVAEVDGRQLRDALRTTETLEYALLTRTLGGGVERLPESGWLMGSARDLAMLAHRASIPSPRVERMGTILEQSIEDAASAFTARHASHQRGSLGADIADLLGQSDDQAGQTRRMAMTVVINALIFHEALAEAEFFITPPPSGESAAARSPLPSAEEAATAPSSLPPSGGKLPKAEGGSRRRLQHLRQLLPPGDFDIDALVTEWQAILAINYWPIFATASEIILKLSEETAAAVLTPLRRGALRLVQRGVTKSHDLTGVIFQRLIADRKFLATFYTRPAAAALLAGLAIPADRAPGGAEWGDEDTIASLQIGDFACGTGTLLSAAYQRISLLHELNGGDPRKLHAPMMKHGLVGLDVLNIAVHLTAATLAGAHPDVPFDGECLLTMPYGRDRGYVGSLELLTQQIPLALIEDAAAITAGGRRPTDVQDLVSRVRHGAFDLVIMNPPFTRPTNHEGEHQDVPNPAYSAFETTAEQQQQMSVTEKSLTKGSAAAGNAGMAALFAELAERKRNENGNLAFVLPLSSMSGSSWNKLRQEWRERFSDTTVITIAAEGSFDRSFSADTGMAECLVVHGQCSQALTQSTDGYFVVLRRVPKSMSEAELLSAEIQRLKHEGEVGAIGSGGGITTIKLGSMTYGTIVSICLPDSGPWTLCGILDLELAEVAAVLTNGKLLQIGNPDGIEISLPIVTTTNIGSQGVVHRDINGIEQAHDPDHAEVRGPFDIVSPPNSPEPSYPVLWAHDAKKERRLTVAPDAEGQIRSWENKQKWVNERAARVWGTATRAHYNLDFRFNSQSLTVAMTERRCVGGRAWPSVILENPEHEYAYSMWCNSTLGLLIHWWVTNKSQNGRGTTTVTAIPNIPTLDTRALTDEQHAEAKRQFDLLSDERFLPFDQIDDDPARAKLDRAILVDVLGLPESLVEDDGPIDLIRRKLAREPQIHGGKKSRVVFTDEGEKSVKRADRS